MAMQSVTDPMMLDSTGQQILSALQDIAEATQPTNVYIDLEVTLPVSGWSNATPSSYTWTSEQVTTECAVEVYFANGSENVLTPYIQYEKGSQSVVFTSPAKPNANIPVIIRIINAKAESINNVTDEMVSTSVISGASNVKQALTTINSDISSLNSKLVNIIDGNPASAIALVSNANTGTVAHFVIPWRSIDPSYGLTAENYSGIASKGAGDTVFCYAVSYSGNIKIVANGQSTWVDSAINSNLATKIGTVGNNEQSIYTINLNWSNALGWHIAVADKEGTVRRIKVDSTDS